ncbi:hypothetical protein [Winogradskyella sp. 4-2091]|uniref:hypothetical protein n=1 Tax=Winogradskyella sp. 4-2091 TaxID=3381659 RepID=UPI003891F1CA
MVRKITFILLLILIYSCKTISVGDDNQVTTTQNIMLGMIGEDQQFILERDYNHTAIPVYNHPLKVQWNIQHFNKSTYKFFSKAAINQNTQFSIDYSDSLLNKPQFLKLELSDRVSILNALNSKINKEIKDYIFNKKDAHLITSISIALDKNRLKELLNADEVFLEATGVKSYALKTYKKGELQTVLSFNEGVIFAYKASNFCWQENDKHQLEIVDIVESTNRCPNKTYRSATRAKKKINYYKL